MPKPFSLHSGSAAYISRQRAETPGAVSEKDMHRILKNLILTTAVAATTLSAIPMAQAGERWRGHHERRPVAEYRHDNTGNLVAAGILGLAVGAIVAGASRPQPVYQDEYDRNPYRHPRPSADRDYFPQPPAPHYVGGDSDYDDYDNYAGSLEPWSRDWYRYCVDRYRSFNPRTGTYTSYSGEQRFCVAD